MDRTLSQIFPRRSRLARAGAAALALSLSAPLAPIAQAGDTWIPGRNGLHISVQSIKERKFRDVVKQQYDFSCGAAAVATLLSAHFETPTGEDNVFANMWANSDQEQVQKVGFSLLDMKRYLVARGFEADGYQVPLDALREAKLPAIALIEQRGYMHFVVVKGVSQDEVLIADPAIGLRTLSRSEFESIRDSVLLVVRSHQEVAQRHFAGNEADWGVRIQARTRTPLESRELGVLTLMQPGLSEF